MQEIKGQSEARVSRRTLTDNARAIDSHVARRIKSRRNSLGITQKNLAEVVGLSYQQIQKYETGSNRVGAGRLYSIGRALNVDAAYFFKDVDKKDFGTTVEQKAGAIPPGIEKAILKLINALSN